MVHRGLQAGLVAMAACCNAGLHALVIGSKHKHGNLLFEKSSSILPWQNAAITMRLYPGEFCTLTDILLLFKRETTGVLLFPGLLAAHFRKGKNFTPATRE
jgi:hypothetical protein